MAFTVNQAFNSTVEVQNSNQYQDYIRIFTVGGQGNSSYPSTDLASVALPWVIGNNLTIGDFSAVCYFFARDLLEYWNTTNNGKYNSSALPPFGLISNNVGGTAIELWSSTTDLNACYNLSPNNAPYGPPYVNGSLYNGMILPYSTGPTSISGWLFYQSEANAPPYQHAPEWYSCLFPKLITNWRTNVFSTSSLPSPSSTSQSTDMPFLFVQIAPFNGTDGWEDIRQAQLSGYFNLQNVGFGTMVDDGDTGSPYGTYHPRNKQLIGQRLANTALDIVYNTPTTWLGPMIDTVSFSTSSDGTTAIAKASFLPNTIPTNGLKYVSQTCPLTIPTSICSDFSIFFKPTPTPTYSYLGAGFLAAGDDCGNGMMMVNEAYVNCTANPVCVGFTFNSNTSNPSTPVNILFKKSLNYFASAGWQAYGSDRDVRGVRIPATGVINTQDNTVTLQATIPDKSMYIAAASYGWSTWPLTPLYSNDEWDLPMIPWYVENSTATV